MICTFCLPQAVKDYGSCCLRYKKNHNFWLTSSYVNISRARSWIKAQNGFIADDSTYLLRHLLPVLIFFVSKWQFKCIHHFFIVHLFTLLSIMSFKAAGLQRIWFSRTFSSGSSRCRQFKNQQPTSTWESANRAGKHDRGGGIKQFNQVALLDFPKMFRRNGSNCDS